MLWYLHRVPKDQDLGCCHSEGHGGGTVRICQAGQGKMMVHGESPCGAKPVAISGLPVGRHALDDVGAETVELLDDTIEKATSGCGGTVRYHWKDGSYAHEGSNTATALMCTIRSCLSGFPLSS